jgi:hypothetical protein
MDSHDDEVDWDGLGGGMRVVWVFLLGVKLDWRGDFSFTSGSGLTLLAPDVMVS